MPGFGVDALASKVQRSRLPNSPPMVPETAAHWPALAPVFGVGVIVKAARTVGLETAVIVRLAVFEVPAYVAVMVTVPLLADEDVETVKTAVDDPAATVTALATATVLLLLARVTATPPDGAFPESVTVP